MDSQVSNASNMGNNVGVDQAAMNQCKCGNKFATDAKFCPFCGELAQSAPPPESQTPTTNQNFTPTPSPPAVPNQPAAPTPTNNFNQTPEKKGLSTGAIVAIVVGVVASLMVCGVVAIFALNTVINDDTQRGAAVEAEDRSEARNQDDDWDWDDDDWDWDDDWDSDWFEPVVLPRNLRGVSVFTERGDQLLYEELTGTSAFEYAFNPNGTFILYLDLSNRNDNFIEGTTINFRERSADLWAEDRNSMPGFDIWPEDQVFYSVMFDGSTATFLGNTTVTDWILFGYMAQRDDGKWILYDTRENLAYVLEEVDGSGTDEEVH